ncbi:MAG: tryptophan-rich sensory protein [Candidatus Omnitrophica bacterium]|nr:tryptophan-rich sensory protein [Candidatus Omnitrophota bacterium]
MKHIRTLKLTASIIICLSAGAIGSLFTSASVDSWYLTLNKPPFNPPSWVFAPVWTLLYILMGVSLFLVLSRENVFQKKKTALIFFSAQLFLNILWSFLFFGMESPLMAFIEIILLWIAIIITIALFKKIYPLSAYLLVPYLLWVTFASVLNYSIFILN